MISHIFSLGRVTAVIGILLLSACDFLPKGKSGNDVYNELAKAAEKKIMQNSDAPIEEVKKLRQVEYRVFRLPMDTAPLELESKLDALGKERWDCFHVERVRAEDGFDLLFMCKRMPETPLMYLKGVLGR